MTRYSWTQTGMVRDPEGSFVLQSELEPTLWQCKDVNGVWQWIKSETYDQFRKEGVTVRALAVVEAQGGEG